MENKIDNNQCCINNEKLCACIKELPQSLITDLQKFEINDNGLLLVFQDKNQYEASLKSCLSVVEKCCPNIRFQVEKNHQSIELHGKHKEGNDAFRGAFQEIIARTCLSAKDESTSSERCC